jgi:hypothetical protein
MRKGAEEPLLRQIIDVLQQVMCTHDTEKLAISIYQISGGSRSLGSRYPSRAFFFSESPVGHITASFGLVKLCPQIT